ncbi:hypothetical protein EVAR_30023_1 [Eumeta japonica]|uniref:Uncharacterized protein n=1 Tax=Eumeta variegata TaxID=151549 RepID=A0A4C1VV23_EUMVA|nr:hypothetical protein EVAR_30023_1 [Eumeta japonica]
MSAVSDWSYSRGDVCQPGPGLRGPLPHLSILRLERNETDKFEKRLTTISYAQTRGAANAARAASGRNPHPTTTTTPNPIRVLASMRNANGATRMVPPIRAHKKVLAALRSANGAPRRDRPRRGVVARVLMQRYSGTQKPGEMSNWTSNPRDEDEARIRPTYEHHPFRSDGQTDRRVLVRSEAFALTGRLYHRKWPIVHRG